MTQNTQVYLKSLPQGKLEESHFEVGQVDVPEPREGQVLVRSILLSLDAANRAWMQGATYREAVQEGDLMHGYAIGEVQTDGERLKKGDIVAGELGWQQYAAMKEKALQQLPNHKPLSHLHSLLGIAGKTAYHGLLNVPGIAEGETLLVSAAAGSVGSIVGQIGRIKGAHVVGIAGGAEKCAWVRDELGFHACIDYKNDDVQKAIRTHCPQGVDVYFDNVGGDILQAALFAMNNRGRISCCGAVSQYDTTEPKSPAGIPGLLVVKRLRMEGFIVMDFADRDDDAVRDLLTWSKSGELKVAEDIVQGIENAPAGLVGLLAGENRGKRMIRVSEDPQ